MYEGTFSRVYQVYKFISCLLHLYSRFYDKAKVTLNKHPIVLHYLAFRRSHKFEESDSSNIPTLVSLRVGQRETAVVILLLGLKNLDHNV